MTAAQEKQAVVDLAARYVCPGRVETFKMLGTLPVMGRREGHYFWDLDGRRLEAAHMQLCDRVGWRVHRATGAAYRNE